MKDCGVVTPFKDVRAYTRCEMGMPGSETALEELMCRVLGDLLQDGKVAKIANVFYCGGNSPEELLSNWHSVLQVVSKINTDLSATRTFICPKTTIILVWVWSQGFISASPHCIATLLLATDQTLFVVYEPFWVLTKFLPTPSPIVPVHWTH